MQTSAFVSGFDVAGEGAGTVLDNLQGRAGLDGALLSVSYHDGRDIFSHNPLGVVRFLEPGALYFSPDHSLYRDTPVKPVVSEFVKQGEDVLAALVGEAEERGMAVHAWTVFLHRDLGRHDSEWAIRNCFGDPLLTDLCPANPHVRAYAVALATDIAARGVQSIMSESLHFAPLEHGYHHERYFLPLSAFSRFLLSVCFCAHCTARGEQAGVDAGAVQHAVHAHLRAAFRDGDRVSTDVSRDEVAALAGGEMAGYLAAREATVTSLIGEVAGAAHDAGVGFAFGDLSGAVKGYADGRPQGAPAAEIAWRLGVDWPSFAELSAGVEAFAYAADPERIELDLADYRKRISDTGALSAAMRPVIPDCDSAENLAAKLRIAQELEVQRVDFYHYGFAPLSALDVIGSALAQAS
jgi:hypothetical protein